MPQRQPLELPPSALRNTDELKPHQIRALMCYEEYRVWHQHHEATQMVGNYTATIRAEFVKKYADDSGFATRTVRAHLNQGQRLWSRGHRTGL